MEDLLFHELKERLTNRIESYEAFPLTDTVVDAITAEVTEEVNEVLGIDINWDCSSVG